MWGGMEMSMVEMSMVNGVPRHVPMLYAAAIPTHPSRARHHPGAWPSHPPYSGPLAPQARWQPQQPQPPQQRLPRQYAAPQHAAPVGGRPPPFTPRQVCA
jgi:hypothetical protein